MGPNGKELAKTGKMFSQVSCLEVREVDDEDIAAIMRGIAPDSLISDLVSQNENTILIGGFDGFFPSNKSFHYVPTFGFVQCQKAFSKVKNLRDFTLQDMLKELSTTNETAFEEANTDIETLEKSEAGSDHHEEELITAKENRKTKKKYRSLLNNLSSPPSGKYKRIQLVINLVPWLREFARNPNGRFAEAEIHQWVTSFRRDGKYSSSIYEVLSIIPSHNHTNALNFNYSHSLYEHLTQDDRAPHLDKMRSSRTWSTCIWVRFTPSLGD